MIPLQFHFCSFSAPPERGGKPFVYANYLCLYSAIKAHPGAIFNFYSDRMIEGEWFERIKQHLTIHIVEPPTEIFAQALKRVEHQADIFRLRILQDKGGIYLDTDIFVCRPFNALLQHNFVMGIENGMGLCNGIIMAEANSPFINEWLAAYHPSSTREGAGFKPDGWGEMSVRFPELLSKSFSEYVTILPTHAFYQPSGSTVGLQLLFEDTEYDNPEAWAQHLWASQAWNKYLSVLEPQHVLTSPGYFHKLARRLLTIEEIEGSAALNALDT